MANTDAELGRDSRDVDELREAKLVTYFARLVLR